MRTGSWTVAGVAPRLGYPALCDLSLIRGLANRPIEQDLHFHADKPLSAYAHEAMLHGRI
ncbi:DUF2958 domain-containing protein [Variovorax rhizosphaerae]|uniref:DUF2958 domain-containing protein n=1 Tax=Variovorax rhizosphaerae TaxID=1836200 RepID=A0ABU8WWC5_9BURK